MPQPIGRVAAITRYPVKSMAGQRLDTAHIGPDGITGDRCYAFLRSDVRTAFPWLTARQVPAMLRCHIAPGDQPHVTTPDGDTWPIDDARLLAWLAAHADEPVHLHHDPHGIFDTHGLSLMTTAAIASIGQQAEQSLNARRFRPNILIEADSDRPYPEDAWVGQTLRFGDAGAVVHVIEPIQRCMMITLDPDSNAKSPGVLRAVAQHHGNDAAIAAHTRTAGSVQVGDTLWLL